jgi:hypothetical protein
MLLKLFIEVLKVVLLEIVLRFKLGLCIWQPDNLREPGKHQRLCTVKETLDEKNSNNNHCLY